MTSKIKLGGRKHSLPEEGSSFSIVDYKAYQYFNKNSKLATRDNVSHYVEHGKIISEFYKVVSEQIVEKEGGVFLDGLGYFGVIQQFQKKATYYDHSKNKISLNTKTDNKIYNLAFVPIPKRNSFFKTWVFDYSFNRRTKSELSKNLKEGKKYSFNSSLFFYKGTAIGNDLKK